MKNDINRVCDEYFTANDINQVRDRDPLFEELNELKELKRWLNYIPWKNNTVLLFNPIVNLITEDANNSKAWSPYVEVLFAYLCHTYKGFGFVLDNNIDDYIGINLFNCINESNSINSFAQKIINMLNSYTEFDLDEKELHILCKAELLKNQNIDIKKENIQIKNKGFFIVTGNMYLKQGINERSNEMIKLIKEL